MNTLNNSQTELLLMYLNQSSSLLSTCTNAATFSSAEHIPSIDDQEFDVSSIFDIDSIAEDSFAPLTAAHINESSFPEPEPEPASPGSTTSTCTSSSMSDKIKASVKPRVNGAKVVKRRSSNNTQDTACGNCGTRDSPSWRRSLDRSMRLCNACGLYEKQRGTHRPTTVRKPPPQLSTRPAGELLKLHAKLREQLEVLERVMVERGLQGDSGDEEGSQGSF